MVWLRPCLAIYINLLEHLFHCIQAAYAHLQLCFPSPVSQVENTTPRAPLKGYQIPCLQEDWRIFAPAFFNKFVCKTHLGFETMATENKNREIRGDGQTPEEDIGRQRGWLAKLPLWKHECNAVQIASNAQASSGKPGSLFTH